MRPLLITFALVSLVGCRHVPPSLSPAVQIVWKANEAGNAVQTLQTVTIGLNSVGVLSDANTKIAVTSVQDGFDALEKVPDGWKATVSAILETVATHVDAAGQSKLSMPILLIEALLNARDLPPMPLPTDDEMRAVFASTLRHARADGQRWLDAHR